MPTTVIIQEPERSQLYNRIRNLLGAPLRGVELEDEMLDSYLQLSIEDYEQNVQDWLIESQWSSVAGLDVDERSVARALATRDIIGKLRIHTHTLRSLVYRRVGTQY